MFLTIGWRLRFLLATREKVTEGCIESDKNRAQRDIGKAETSADL
jgi:hypothetical protein